VGRRKSYSLTVGKKARKAQPLAKNTPEHKKKDKKGFRSFEELECWKACTEVRRFITELVKSYPKEEKFGIAGDMKRAARSTTHNIAEGFGRYHFQENIQFCRVSRGSLHELIDQLFTSKDEEFITDADYRKGRELIARALPLLNGYINYLSRQRDEFYCSEE
jgi:four helix bundle protein